MAFLADDLEALKVTREVLAKFGIQAEPALLKAGVGDNPDLSEFTEKVQRDGVQLVIVAARESGPVRALAAALTAPVIRVPVARDGSPEAALATLLPMAAGEPTRPAGARSGSCATVALGEAGARNAALLAVSILALTDPALCAAWKTFRAEQTNAVLAEPAPSG